MDPEILLPPHFVDDMKWRSKPAAAPAHPAAIVAAAAGSDDIGKWIEIDDLDIRQFHTQSNQSCMCVICGSIFEEDRLGTKIRKNVHNRLIGNMPGQFVNIHYHHYYTQNVERNNAHGDVTGITHSYDESKHLVDVLNAVIKTQRAVLSEIDDYPFCLVIEDMLNIPFTLISYFEQCIHLNVTILLVTEASNPLNVIENLVSYWDRPELKLNWVLRLEEHQLRTADGWCNVSNIASRNSDGENGSQYLLKTEWKSRRLLTTSYSKPSQAQRQPHAKRIEGLEWNDAC